MKVNVFNNIVELFIILQIDKYCTDTLNKNFGSRTLLIYFSFSCLTVKFVRSL